MPQATQDNHSTSQSPMIWVIIAVIALIMIFVFFSGRPNTKIEQISLDANEKPPVFTGEIARQDSPQTQQAQQQPELKEPTARDLIRLAREKGEPYPLQSLHEQALQKQTNKDMENAHLLFFFSAREGYLPSILKMGEMADPILFNSSQSLLDQADPIQAYKWYKIAIERNAAMAQDKMDALKRWSVKEASAGNKIAQQLQLNFSGAANEQ